VAGQRAAAAVLAARKDDGAAAPEAYRPHTSPGTYVPTSVPIASQWPARKPWLMSGAAQFRPGPPPALRSERWARDFAEIKSVGSHDSAERSPEQTAQARFWETTLPTIYYGLVQSVAARSGRDVTQNARLYAAVTQAIDDAMIAVFDAKYHYGFWRPITAIRNGDSDDNEATLADRTWTPFIETPLHPEYPCAHCIVAATVGTVLLAELGGSPEPVWRTVSPTANGAAREWTNIEAFVQEVADARVYDGVHFRYSTEVGTAMGRQIGALAAARRLRP
jgi:PAP2 superfamily